MTDRDVKRAIETNLHGLQMSEQMRLDILAGVEGGKRVKKKLSTSLVLTAVLIMLAACALAAALLSGRDFVSNVMAPAAMENASDRWSQEEVDEILRIAEEHGLALDADTMAKLAEQDGVFKEELMRLFVKLDLGFYPSTWPIEDQVWYEQMQVDTGLKTLEEVARFLPEEGGITQEDAIAIAQRVIHEQYDPLAELDDEAVYLRHLTYQNLVSMDGTEGRGWYVEYQARGLAHDGYVVHIWPDGRVFDPQVFPGIGGDSDVPADPIAIGDRYRDVYGMWFDWEMETWIAYAADMKRSYAYYPNAHGRMLMLIAQQTYGIPDGAALGEAAAITLATAAVAEHEAVLESALLLESAYGVYLLGEEVPVWKMAIPQREKGNWLVELNAYTGEVRDIRFWEYGESPAQAFVLQSLIDALPELSDEEMSNG